MHFERYFVAVGLFVTLVDILPLVFHLKISHQDDSNKLAKALKSSELIIPMVFAFATTIPLLVDVLTYVIHKDSYYYYERLALLIACNLPILISYITRESKENANIFTCLYCIQSVWIGGALLNGVVKSSCKIWGKTRIFVIFTLIAFAQAITPYTGLHHPLIEGVIIIMNLAVAAAFAGYLYLYFTYIRRLIGDESELLSNSSEYLPILCSTMVLLYTIGSGIIGIVYSVEVPENMGIDAIIAVLLLTSTITVFSTLLPGRVARSQVREVESSLEIKKSFVRYIGHEIRTPLNVASIGLDLLSQLVCSNASRFQNLSKDAGSSKCPQVNHISEPASLNTTIIQSALESSSKSLQSTRNLEAMAAMLVSSKNIEGLSRQASKACGLADSSTFQDVESVIQETRSAIALSTNILNDLLSYDKLDSDNMTIEISNLDVKQLVQESLSMFALQAESKRVKLDVDVEESLPILKGDPYKLRQVLCNLASNAMKFTPVNGSVHVRVKRDPRKPNHYLMIEFQDSGVGIAKQNLRKVFKKIIQFDANANQAGGGSGLGLFITRGLVELHGGSVSVSSEGLGKGCMFKVRLPFDKNKHRYMPYRGKSSWPSRMLKDLFHPANSNRMSSAVELESLRISSIGRHSSAPPASQEGLSESDYAALMHSESMGIGQACSDEIDPSGDGKLGSSIHSINNGAVVVASEECDIAAMENGDAVMSMKRSFAPALDSRNVLLPMNSKKYATSSSNNPESTSSPSAFSGLFGRKVVPTASETHSSDSKPNSIESGSAFAAAAHAPQPSLGVAKHIERDETSSNSVADSLRLGSGSQDSTTHSVPQLGLSTISRSAHSNVNSEVSSNVSRQPSASTVSSSGRVPLSHSNSAMDSSRVGNTTNPSSGNRTAHPTRWLEGMTALLVDDSQSSLKMLAMLLKRHGCHCVTATDGSEAIEIVNDTLHHNTDKSLFLDFVLMDNYMTTICGPSACKEMRSLGFRNPIIGLTGHALEDDVAVYKEAGANDVLVKPLDINLLQVALRRLIPTLQTTA